MPAMAQSSYAASKLKVSPSKKTISVKKTVKLTAKGLSAKQLKKVKWSTTTAGKKVVKLSASKGKTIKVTGKKAGKATITAKYGKKKAKATITVKAAATKTTVASVKIDNTTPNVGDTLTATLADKDGNAVTADATYQWYRMVGTSEIEIPAATAATYQTTDQDINYAVYVKATVAGNSIKSAATKAVTEKRTLKSVEIVLPNEHKVPQVNDTLKIKVLDSLGNDVTALLSQTKDNTTTNYATVQWYANGAKISGATGTSYKVLAAQEGKKISVKVTANTDYAYFTKGEVESVATEAVVASQIPTKVEVKGYAGAAPAVGEVLTASFTAPENASDDAATYQWYRGTRAIDGATASTYTVTSNDAGQTIYVKATLSTIKAGETDNTALTSAATKAVQKAIADAKVTVKSGLTDKATIFTTDTSAIAEVSKTKSTSTASITANDYKYAWYVDSVADANQLYSAPYNATAKTQANTYETDSLALNGDFYLKGATEKTSIVGHKLVVVATSNVATINQGSLTSEATSEVKIPVAEPTFKSDTGTTYVADKTKLSVSVAKVSNADPTVSYKWYSTKKVESDPTKTVWTALSETSSSYKITTADKEAGVVAYKVEATGTGNYYLDYSYSTVATTIQSADAKVTEVSPLINGKATINVQPGAELTASMDADAATEYMTYTWTYSHDGKKTTATGKAYTVPATAAKGDTVVLTAATTKDDYEVKTDASATATVESKIKSIAISNTIATKNTSVNGYDGVANPSVGETLSVKTDPTDALTNATVEWYVGSVKKSTENTYVIPAEAIGKKISVKVTGGEGYSTSELTAETGTVKATGTLKITSAYGTVLTNATAGKVGTVLNATVSAEYYVKGTLTTDKAVDITDQMTYVWTVGGKEVSATNNALSNNGKTYTIQPEDAGKLITCEASNTNVVANPTKAAGFETALKWANGLQIAE